MAGTGRTRRGVTVRSRSDRGARRHHQGAAAFLPPWPHRGQKTAPRQHSAKPLLPAHNPTQALVPASQAGRHEYRPSLKMPPTASYNHSAQRQRQGAAAFLPPWPRRGQKTPPSQHSANPLLPAPRPTQALCLLRRQGGRNTAPPCKSHSPPVTTTALNAKTKERRHSCRRGPKGARKHLHRNTAPIHCSPRPARPKPCACFAGRTANQAPGTRIFMFSKPCRS